MLCSVLVRAWEWREEERRKKGEGKKKRRKRKREKGKRGKGDVGGIRGDGREPGVASTRSDAHEKRGKQEKIDGD